MSTIISFFGGPGVGKSTAASYVYCDLKTRGKSVELVREVVKDWAWEGRKINGFAQYYTTAKQIMKESLLLGKVDYIVTDSPPLLGIAYAEKYYSENIAKSIKATVEGYYAEADEEGHEFKLVFLNRRAAYTNEGRWEDEKTAKNLDDRIWGLTEGCWDYEITSSASALKALVDDLLEGK